VAHNLPAPKRLEPPATNNSYSSFRTWPLQMVVEGQGAVFDARFTDLGQKAAFNIVKRSFLWEFNLCRVTKVSFQQCVCGLAAFLREPRWDTV
jgi:hypothetical protein